MHCTCNVLYKFIHCINIVYANSNTQNFYVQNYYIHELMQKKYARIMGVPIKQ